MAQVVGTLGAGIKRRTVYIRKKDTYIRPTDLTGIHSLIDSATEFGKFDDKSIKWSFEEGEKRALNDGSEMVLEWNGKFEAALANFTPGNVDDFEQNFDGEYCDVILDDPVAKDMVVITNILLHGKDDETSGDKGVYHISGIKKVARKANFRDRFDYSSFS